MSGVIKEGKFRIGLVQMACGADPAENLERAAAKVEDMLKSGIIDPTKVTKNALQNAASVAGLMLTTEALVSEIKEKEKAPAAGGGMPGGMGGMY